MKKLFFNRRLDAALLVVLFLTFQGEKGADVPKGYSVAWVPASLRVNSMGDEGRTLHPTQGPIKIYVPNQSSSKDNGVDFITTDGTRGKASKSVIRKDYDVALREVAARNAPASKTKPALKVVASNLGQFDNACGGVSLTSDIPIATFDQSQKFSRGRIRDHRPSRKSPASPPVQPKDSSPNSPAPESPAPEADEVDVAVNTDEADTPVVPPPGAPIAHDNPITATLGSASDIGDFAGRSELVDSSLAAMRASAENARSDHRVLGDSYRPLGLSAMAERLERAKNALSDTVQMIDQSTGSSLESSEKARFRNHFLNAQDKAQLGLDAIKDTQRAEERGGLLGSNSPLSGLLGFGPKVGDPLAKTPALAGIFGGGEGEPRKPASGPSMSNATTNDALTNRIVMLSGLPDDEREQALQKLKLLERPKFKLPNGKQVNVDLLHNGYILGGGTSGVDCSSFVSSVLPADVRKGNFTTLDFRAMWIYARTQEFPSPPKYTDERAKLVKETASSFIPINLYDGEPLKMGDILVYRFERDPIGHVVIVRSYNPDTLRAEIIEAAQSAGAIRERTLNLSADPLTVRRRYLLPGLWALRLKPVSSKACSYRDSARTPAGESLPEAPSVKGEAR